MNNSDVMYTREIKPLKALSNKKFDRWVTFKSAEWQKKHIVMIRRFQGYECDDGCTMNTTDNLWKEVQAYTFTDNYFDHKTKSHREWLVGSACFNRYTDGIQLDFCWIHPFWRNKGLLKKAWPAFIEKFGNFYISQPISKPMQGFLNSVDYQEPLN